MSFSCSRLVLSGLLACLSCRYLCAQQPSGPDSSTTSSTQTSAASAATSTGKKSKKVWTNENLSEANGPVSVVGDPQHPINGKTDSPADPNYAASVKKQIEKLTGQMSDIDKQLADLKSFSEGEPTATPARQLHKGYNTEPIAQQMEKLQTKKKELQAKIDGLLDEARKKGVLPGQLR